MHSYCSRVTPDKPQPGPNTPAPITATGSVARGKKRKITPIAHEETKRQRLDSIINKLWTERPNKLKSSPFKFSELALDRTRFILKARFEQTHIHPNVPSKPAVTDDASPQSSFEPIGSMVKHNAPALTPWSVIEIQKIIDLQLQSACANGNQEAAKDALQLGADITAKSRSGKTALEEACSGGHYKIIGVLLDHGAPIEPRVWRCAMEQLLTKQSKSLLIALLTRINPQYTVNGHFTVDDEITILLHAREHTPDLTIKVLKELWLLPKSAKLLFQTILQNKKPARLDEHDYTLLFELICMQPALLENKSILETASDTAIVTRLLHMAMNNLPENVDEKYQLMLAELLPGFPVCTTCITTVELKS